MIRNDQQSFPRRSRITRAPEIRTLLRSGKRARTPRLDVFVAASRNAFSRLATIVPRHRHSIVERNRLKRRLREIGRRELLPRLKSAGISVDLMVRTRSDGYDATFDDLREELVGWVEGWLKSPVAS